MAADMDGAPPAPANQSPEQVARDAIDAQLRAAGWAVQAKSAIDFHAGEGQAVREYSTDSGPADYVLFVDGQPIGVIEAKKETLGQTITVAEDQAADYAAAKLKWIQSSGAPLPFLYQATGVIVRFTDQRDPKPRSREVFSFHRPETLRAWLAAPGPGQQARPLRARLHDLPALDPTGLRDCQIEAITNLDASLKAAKPRALVQMATGSGKIDRALRQSEALRQAILQEAFTGRLVPQYPTNEPASELLARQQASRSRVAVPQPRFRKTKNA